MPEAINTSVKFSLNIWYPPITEHNKEECFIKAKIINCLVFYLLSHCVSMLLNSITFLSNSNYIQNVLNVCMELELNKKELISTIPLLHTWTQQERGRVGIIQQISTWILTQTLGGAEVPWRSPAGVTDTETKVLIFVPQSLEAGLNEEAAAEEGRVSVAVGAEAEAH